MLVHVTEPKFRDQTVLARVVVGMLGVQALTFVWCSASIAFRTWIVHLEWLWEAEQALGGPLQATYWATGIAFLVWFYRAHQNITALGDVARHGSGYAVGSWFIPFVGWVVPCQAATDIWRGSVGPPSHDPDAVPRQQGEALVVSWWVAFLTSGLAASISSVVSGIRSSDYETVNAIAIVSDLLSLVAAVLAMLFVHRITERQRATAASDGPLVF
jgi:hypothetical protein